MPVNYNDLRGKWWEKRLCDRPTGKTQLGMKDSFWGAEKWETEGSQASGSNKGETMIWGGQRQQCVWVRKGHLFNIPAVRWKNASGDFSEQRSQMQEHLKGGLLFESATDRYDESILSGQKNSHPLLILPFPSPLLHFSKQSSLFPWVSILHGNPVCSLNFNRPILTLIILHCSKYWTIWRIVIFYDSAKTLTSQKYQYKEMRYPLGNSAARS